MPKKVNSSQPRPVHVPYERPEQLTFFQAVRRAIYNPQTKAVLGRTPKSWGGIVLFYTFFMTGLITLFSTCMYVLIGSLSPHEPRYQLDDSLIGTNPGLGFRPYSEDVEKHGSLIWYVASNETNVKKWTSTLDDFLRGYVENKHPENKVICDFDRPPAPKKVCNVNVDDFGPCAMEKGYSYNQSSPCVFIKLNRIFNWIPECYNTTDNLPEDMDEDLKSHISETLPEERNVIWISCYGENPADRENVGSIKYYPKRGFPGYFYPFTNPPGYLSPLVAVHFERPSIHRLMNIECRAWAKNIRYKRGFDHREGSVHFELLID